MGRNPVFLGRLYSFRATALGLLDLVYFCNALSTGQLPSQVWQPCTHSVLRFFAPPLRGNVSFDLLQELFRLATLFQ